MTDVAPKRTWRDLWEMAGRSLSSHDAIRIIEEVSGYSRGELVQHGNESAAEVAFARIQTMISRRQSGEPLQYVLGSWSFRELDLHVDNRVLIPRPETEVVAGVAIDDAKGRKSPLVVDLGTGSGAIALSVAFEVQNARVIATDLSGEALAVARANLAGIGLAGSRVQLFEGRWFSAIPDELKGKIDIVVSNPPYVRDDEILPEEVSKYEPSQALFAGPLGTEDLEEIVSEAPAWLKSDGSVVLECAPDQAEYVQKCAMTAGFDATIICDLAGKQRVVHAHKLA